MLVNENENILTIYVCISLSLYPIFYLLQSYQGGIWVLLQAFLSLLSYQLFEVDYLKGGDDKSSNALGKWKT